MDGTTQAQAINSLISNVGVDYFKTLRTPLLAGRECDAHDTPAASPVAIVNQAFARRLTGGENPVGRRFSLEATPATPETAYEIVGLVRIFFFNSSRPTDFPLLSLPRPLPS